MERINYKDIITAINEKSNDINLFRNCKEITNTIGYTINEQVKNDWRIKFVGFVFNFIMEETFLQLAKNTKEFEGIQYIQPETHYYFHKGNGNAMADFILPNGKTVETKKFKSIDRLNEAIAEGSFRWHNADYKIAYLRREKMFYDVIHRRPIFQMVDIPWISVDSIPNID